MKGDAPGNVIFYSQMNPTIGQLIPVRRLFNVVDERAAVFLNADISSIAIQEPDKLGSRLCVNADIPLEFENDHFKGRVVIIHREPSESTNHYRYRELLSARKRRWELRWQGKFKQSLPKSVLFGAEIQSSHAPKINIASRTFLSILLRFSKVLARSRGSDLFTNVLKDELGETKYFYFPIHTSDMILSTPEGEAPPDIASVSPLCPEGQNKQCNADFKDLRSIDITKTYTFVFYSMYVDFVTWDVQNVPIGLNGMSLNRLVGNQPISVTMRTGDGIVGLGGGETPIPHIEYFRLVVGNRCTSPSWSSYLTSGNPHAMSEFFSVVSSFDSGDVAITAVSPRRTVRRPEPIPPQGGRLHAFFRGIKRIMTVPTRYIGTCLRAPVSFVINPTRRQVPEQNRVVVRKPTAQLVDPQPDATNAEFVTPMSEGDENKT